MTNLTRRIERLEGAAGTQEGPTCIVVRDYPDEPTDVAVARYRAEHPDTPEHARFIVFISGFSRAPGAVA
jgi:hypothetical protein